MLDYSNFGYDRTLRRTTSLSSRLRERISQYTSALQQDLYVERTPIVNTIISKGTLQTNLGGVLEVKDTTGGTTLFTVNPTTGVTTITGSLVTQQALSLGTIIDTVIAGQGTIRGTITNERLIQNGTYNTGTFGTPNVIAGTFGTPNILGGTHNNAFFGTLQTAGGTIGTPIITGTPTFDVNAGTAALSTAGNFAIQTLSGSAILVVRVGTISYKFTSNGTMI